MPIVVIGLLLTVVDWHWEMRWLELCSALCSVYRLRLLCSSHVSVVGGECCLLRWYLFFFRFLRIFCIAYPLVATYTFTDFALYILLAVACGIMMVR